MTRAGVSILLGAACSFAAATRPLSSQPTPAADSTRVSVFHPKAATLCPMPVYIPDLSRVERMPVAPTDARGHFMQVVRPSCVNPLFRPAAPNRATRLPVPAAPRARFWEHLPVPSVYLVPWR